MNDYDFDSPDAIDFEVLVDRLRDLKAGFVLLRFGLFIPDQEIAE
jgi:uridine kinase